MNKKSVFLLLTFLGLVLPYSQFIPFIIDNGLNLQLLYSQMMINHISRFFVFDVVISALALFAFMRYDQQKIKVRFWQFTVLGTLTVGVSFGLPLYLYLRETSLEDQK